MLQTVLVVPCYNEAQRLDAQAFRSFVATTGDVRLLFVNDGSTDDTAEVLDAMCRDEPAFDVMHLERNQGKAGAVREGILAALETRPDLMGFWDADLSTPLEELPAFLAVFEKQPDIEMVFGARVNLLGRSIRRKLTRHYIGRVFATIVATTLRLPVYDTQCGAKVFRVTQDFAGLFGEPFLSKWIFDVEIIARSIASRRGTDRPPVIEIIYELPLMTWHDVDGSKLRLSDFVVVMGDFVRIYRKYVRSAG
jgi:glycosyltransferase involved in cell wall biosynthesis